MKYPFILWDLFFITIQSVLKMKNKQTYFVMTKMKKITRMKNIFRPFNNLLYSRNCSLKIFAEYYLEFQE